MKLDRKGWRKFTNYSVKKRNGNENNDNDNDMLLLTDTKAEKISRFINFDN